jgi:hypothetical protein
MDGVVQHAPAPLNCIDGLSLPKRQGRAQHHQHPDPHGDLLLPILSLPEGKRLSQTGNPNRFMLAASTLSDLLQDIPAEMRCLFRNDQGPEQSCTADSMKWNEQF